MTWLGEPLQASRETYRDARIKIGGIDVSSCTIRISRDKGPKRFRRNGEPYFRTRRARKAWRAESPRMRFVTVGSFKSEITVEGYRALYEAIHGTQVWT